MSKNIQQESIAFIQDMDQAIAVMQSAGKWMKDSRKNPSKWGQNRKTPARPLFIKK